MTLTCNKLRPSAEYFSSGWSHFRKFNDTGLNLFQFKSIYNDTCLCISYVLFLVHFIRILIIEINGMKYFQIFNAICRLDRIFCIPIIYRKLNGLRPSFAEGLCVWHRVCHQQYTNEHLSPCRLRLFSRVSYEGVVKVAPHAAKYMALRSNRDKWPIPSLTHSAGSRMKIARPDLVLRLDSRMMRVTWDCVSC